MRLLRGLTAAVLGVALLGGCSPPDDPVVALGVRDGAPIIVLVACSLEFAQASVFRDDPDPPTEVSPASEFRSWHVSGDPPARIMEIVPFELPEGWHLSNASLDELEPGVRYAVGTHRGISVHFTLDDLGRLDAEHVLVGRLGKPPKVVGRAGFESGGEKACAKR